MGKQPTPIHHPLCFSRAFFSPPPCAVSQRPAVLLVALDFKGDLGPLALFLQIRFQSLKSKLARNFVSSQAGLRAVSGQAQVTITLCLRHRRPERSREDDVRARVSSRGESGGIFERGLAGGGLFTAATGTNGREVCAAVVDPMAGTRERAAGFRL